LLLGDEKTVEECAALVKTTEGCKDGYGFFNVGNAECYCCTVNDVAHNYDNVEGFALY